MQMSHDLTGRLENRSTLVELRSARPSEMDTPVTELLLSVVVAARVLGLLEQKLTIPRSLERSIAALHLLIVLGPLRASELAALLGISRAAATRLIDTLEQAGLAHREPDPRDRRAILVAATPAGRLVALSEIAPPAAISLAAHRLPPELVAALSEGLERLLRELTQGLPQTHRHNATSSRVRRSKNGTTQASAATAAPATSGQPEARPTNSVNQPLAKAPRTTPRE
jgi:DNA-binding MarR family transcriptional regulator